MINNAKIANALGFLTENVKSQKDLIYRFPYGVLNLRNLMLDLKAKKIMPPYGNYNNNYLSNDNTLLYSDDLELCNITHQVLEKLPPEKLNQPKFFAISLAIAMKNHWLLMKKSGDYGLDGLYHGKRGYSKNTLLVLSSLSPEMIAQNQWNNKWPNRSGNDTIVRSWIIGVNNKIASAEEAYKLAQAQLYITNSDDDMAMAAGSISTLFYKLNKSSKISKKEVMQYLIDDLTTRVGEASPALKAVKLGVNLANKAINPIILYNSIAGFGYADLLTLLVYSFLYFDDFSTALINIVHTTGDNDSLAFILGALFGIYDGKSLSPEYLQYLEAKDINLSS
jgi:ADP-ribosylglycohydrolase